jgi:hypothetical protein
MPRVPAVPIAVLSTALSLWSGSLFGQSTNSETSNPAIRSATPQELPDSPGAVWAKSQSPDPQATAAQSSGAQPSSGAITQEPASDTGNGDKDKNDQKLQRPVGTAAAEAPKVSGITAAEPAGAAIAPAKQHRVRTLVIKMGAILGASAAIGTVVALSAATPSKPPGAH